MDWRTKSSSGILRVMNLDPRIAQFVHHPDHVINEARVANLMMHYWRDVAQRRGQRLNAREKS